VTGDPDSVVIVGGGIAGLATAALLAREGRKVTLLEQQDVVGGRAGLWESDAFRFDTGPSWYLMPEVFDHFFRLLGTSTAEQLDLVTLDPGYRVFFENGRDPIDIVADRDANRATFERAEAGAGAAFDRYLASARETYRMAVDKFLYSTFQSFRPLVTGDLIRRAGRLGRLLVQPLDRFAAGFVRDAGLRQILGYPAVFLGTSPSRAPSMYHLMSHLDMEDGVRYPLGGFRVLIDRIAAIAVSEGVRIETGAQVTAIRTHEVGSRRSRVSGVDYVDSAGVDRRIQADTVVSAADLHHTETQLIPGELSTYPERWWSKRDPGPGAVLVLLGVRGELPQLAHHSLFFTTDWTDNFDRIFGAHPSIPDPASLYVCRPSATDPGVAPEGHENLFILIPVPADPSIGGGSHQGETGAGASTDSRVEKAADAAIRQIASWAGIPDLADRIVVRRTIGPADFADDLNAWRGGALGPGHTLRQSAFFRGRNQSSTVDGLLYAGGTTIPGIGLPMCLISAELVVKRLRGDVSTGRLTEPLAAATAAQGERSV